MNSKLDEVPYLQWSKLWYPRFWWHAREKLNLLLETYKAFIVLTYLAAIITTGVRPNED